MIPIIPVPIIRRKIIVQRFLKAGAISKESAVSPTSINVKQVLLFSRLEAKGIIVHAGEGKYFLGTNALK